MDLKDIYGKDTYICKVKDVGHMNGFSSGNFPSFPHRNSNQRTIGKTSQLDIPDSFLFISTEWVSEWSSSVMSDSLQIMDCSLPGSSVYGIFQARVLEWIAISFSRGSSRPRDRTQVSHIVGTRFTVWATREILYLLYTVKDKPSYLLIYNFPGRLTAYMKLFLSLPSQLLISRQPHG